MSGQSDAELLICKMLLEETVSAAEQQNGQRRKVLDRVISASFHYRMHLVVQVIGRMAVLAHFKIRRVARRGVDLCRWSH